MGLRKCLDRSFFKIAKLSRNVYTSVKLKWDKRRGDIDEGMVNVTEIVRKIQSLELPPHQLRELGLGKDWQKEVSVEYIEKVVSTAERYKEDLKELSKR